MYFVCYIYKADGPKKNTEGYKPLKWPLGLGALAAFLVTMFVPLSLPMPYIILWTGVSCFLFLTWFSQLIQWSWLTTLCKAMSACSFSVFLVHHILVGIFMAPYAGRTLSFQENHELFFQYFLFISITGFIFYRLSLIANRLITWFTYLLLERYRANHSCLKGQLTGLLKISSTHFQKSYLIRDHDLDIHSTCCHKQSH